MTEIEKKNGKKETFDAMKIRRSVHKTLIDADIRSEDHRALIEELVELTRNEKTSDNIRRIILGRLDDRLPNSSDAWRKFDKKYKK